MDKRERTDRDFYANKPHSGSAFDEYVEEGGRRYMLPYRTVKQAVFAGIRKDEIKDWSHAARLQYKLLLLDPVLRAKVDADRRTISVIYNPDSADNRNEKMSLKALVGFLEREGVRVSEKDAEVRDFDYRSEMYEYNYDPKEIRERPPFGYTIDEWHSGMKSKFEKSVQDAERKKLAEFYAWREEFKKEHPELGKA